MIEHYRYSLADLDTLAWHTPPECQGQIILTSYAVDPERGLLLSREVDQSYPRSDARRVVYYAMGAENFDGLWDPWNGAPDFGPDPEWEGVTVTP